jgi:hypothetical protein
MGVAYKLGSWPRGTRGDSVFVVLSTVGLQFLIGLIFFMPLCCQGAWSTFIGSQYGAFDCYLVFRLLIIPWRRGRKAPDITIPQRILVLRSPLLIAFVSVQAFERLWQ